MSRGAHGRKNLQEMIGGIEYVNWRREKRGLWENILTVLGNQKGYIDEVELFIDISEDSTERMDINYKKDFSWASGEKNRAIIAVQQ